MPGAERTLEIHFSDGRVVTDFSRIVPGPDGTRAIGRIWVFEDITEQRRVANQLLHLAERDPPINLFNRRRFHEELERMLADGRRHREGWACSPSIWTGFKPVNDSYGHRAGDEVLIGSAGAVASVVRRNEMFFRMGATSSRSSCRRPNPRGWPNWPGGCAPVLQALELFLRPGAGQGDGHGEHRHCPEHSPRGGRRVPDRCGRPWMYRAKALGGNCWEFAKDAVGTPLD